MAKTPLHLHYRPTRWEQVIGNAVAIRSLREAVERRSFQAYLLTGPSGVGKTTLARLAAAALGCKPSGLNEIDGATFTGIDEMRAITDAIRYRPFGSPVRVVILDECHSLSPKAWESLLKSIEEPPEFAFWFFCTTQAAKVPATIKTRCLEVHLKGVEPESLVRLVERVARTEQIALPDQVAKLVAYTAAGSPRQALVYLATVRGLKSYAEAAKALTVLQDSDPAIAFCRYLVNGRPQWPQALGLLGKLEDSDPESVRILVCNYVAKVLQGEQKPDRAAHLLNVLNSFSVPYYRAEGNAPLYLSMGRIIFTG